MDATDASPQRLALAVELFAEGQEVLHFFDVRFHLDSGGVLCVDSFSQWEPERTTESHARAQIARSKEVLAQLTDASPRFAAIASQRPVVFTCCHNYGSGSVALAQESAGVFRWLR